MEEILDLVMYEIKRSGYEKKLIGGIVLTGGGALLKNFELLCEYHTGLQTRIGFPNEHFSHGMNDRIASPIFATGVGLLMYGLKMKESQSVSKIALRKEKPVEVLEPAVAAVTQTELGLGPILAPGSNNSAKSSAENQPKSDLVKLIKRFFEPTPDPDLR
jgi:cell division protein FtsA